METNRPTNGSCRQRSASTTSEPTATERFTREDATVAGVTIPRGSLVYAALASANRDERQFPDVDRLDLAREPNRHVAFGLAVAVAIGSLVVLFLRRRQLPFLPEQVRVG